MIGQAELELIHKSIKSENNVLAVWQDNLVKMILAVMQVGILDLGETEKIVKLLDEHIPVRDRSHVLSALGNDLSDLVKEQKDLQLKNAFSKLIKREDFRALLEKMADKSLDEAHATLSGT